MFLHPGGQIARDALLRRFGPPRFGPTISQSTLQIFCRSVDVSLGRRFARNNATIPRTFIVRVTMYFAISAGASARVRVSRVKGRRYKDRFSFDYTVGGRIRTREFWAKMWLSVGTMGCIHLLIADGKTWLACGCHNGILGKKTRLERMNSRILRGWIMTSVARRATRLSIGNGLDSMEWKQWNLERV
jgi:hypothetical protein